jgi:hypothetical protein
MPSRFAWADEDRPPRIDELDLADLRALQRQIVMRVNALIDRSSALPRGEFVFRDGTIRVCTMAEYWRAIGWVR